MSFNIIKQAVAKQFQSMVGTGLFRMRIDGDTLWNQYLASFPPGTNPIFKTRTEHDCSCCRHFIKNLGGVVTIKDGELITLWDFRVEGPYQPVVDAMGDLVRFGAIENIFLHPEKTVGVNKSNSMDAITKEVTTWDHFFVNLPAAAHETGEKIGPRISEATGTHDVLLRSLKEIDIASIDTVLDLIRQNSLYRGEENQFAVSEFRKLAVEFKQAKSPELFVWDHIGGKPSVTRIRSTAIGTLLVDLAEGKDLEEAVKSFESKVAPTNYKRPTALVTPAMIKKAQAAVEELGLTSALERRYATIEDVTINNVIFADRQARKKMNVFEELGSRVPQSTKALDKVEEVSIEAFLSNIVPQADSIEVMVENRHASNLVSLIAPVDPTAQSMFKWGSRFSWSYAGELADSIKERVKRAGGNVVGDFRASLSWTNFDDLDLHLIEPDTNEIFFRQKTSFRTGGQLDVDMNAGGGQTRSAVENIFYPERKRMQEGEYKLFVHQFSRRETVDVGFEVEMEFDGQVHLYSYPKAVKDKEAVVVARFEYSHKSGLKVIGSLPSSVTSKVLWGIPTQTFHKVDVVMLSPNHWNGAGVGNKHYFFMLNGCLNEGTARGFFNEFLSEQLSPHRKVLEMVGAKMKTEESSRQLSGLGFSSTQRNHLLCKVTGSFTRTVKVTF